MSIYELRAKRHEPTKYAPKAIPDTVLFYDEDKELVIREMEKYRKKHGFTIAEAKGTFTIADLILRERKPTGEVIKDTPYREIFNVYDERIEVTG